MRRVYPPKHALQIIMLVGIYLLVPNNIGAINNLDGKKEIRLLDKKGQSTPIGHILFSSEGNVSSYKLHLDHKKFQDYFLSMKEMKCLEGPELWCHIPYPYKHPHTVSSSDLRWLSHDLLFMFKKNGTFGANFWNGIYYTLQFENGVIKGVAQAVDLNTIASPPDDLTIPPLGEADRDEINRSSRWLPDIEIR